MIRIIKVHTYPYPFLSVISVSTINKQHKSKAGVAIMILVTGATGYIGSHLVKRLVAQGERPRCLVRDPKRAATLLPADEVEFVHGDTTQPSLVEAAVQGVDTIVHTAFITA